MLYSIGTLSASLNLILIPVYSVSSLEYLETLLENAAKAAKLRVDRMESGSMESKFSHSGGQHISMECSDTKLAELIDQVCVFSETCLMLYKCVIFSTYIVVDKHHIMLLPKRGVYNV